MFSFFRVLFAVLLLASSARAENPPLRMIDVDYLALVSENATQNVSWTLKNYAGTQRDFYLETWVDGSLYANQSFSAPGDSVYANSSQITLGGKDECHNVSFFLINSSDAYLFDQKNFSVCVAERQLVKQNVLSAIPEHPVYSAPLIILLCFFFLSREMVDEAQES